MKDEGGFMLPLFRIWAVARYEAMDIMRGKLFLLSFPFLIAVMVLANVYFFMYYGSALWTYRAIPSSIPYGNTLLLNFLLTIVAVFLTIDSFEKRNREGIIASLKARSFTNIEYVSGKAAGLLFVFGIIHITVLFAAGIMNLVFVRDAPICIGAYLYYPLLISFPAAAAFIGMAFPLIILMRNKSLAAILLLGILFISKYYSGRTGSYYTDIFAFNTPLAFSSFTGFVQPFDIIVRRIHWLLIGICGIFAAAYLCERPEQSRSAQIVAFSVSLISVVGIVSIFLVHTRISHNHAELRTQIRGIDQHALKNPSVTLTHCRIELTHLDREIDVDAKLRFTNQTGHALQRYAFGLNPGLSIKRVTAHGKNLQFNRNIHMVTIVAPNALAEGESDSLDIQYSGSIRDYTCFADVPEKTRNKPFSLNFIKIDKRSSFLLPRYLLLTAESLWYPTTGAPYGSAPPNMQPQRLVHFTLTVHSKPGLTVLSQGEMHRIDTQTVSFRPEHLCRRSASLSVNT